MTVSEMAIYRKVVEIAQADPKHVYMGQGLITYHQTSSSEACLFGQAMTALGINVDALNGTLRVALYALGRAGLVQLDAPVAVQIAATQAQTSQDSRMEWGHAVVHLARGLEALDNDVRN